MRIFGFAPRQLAALTLPFLVYHLLVFAMITGIVPGFWETFQILLTLAGALAVYGLALPILVAFTAHAGGHSGVRAWLISQSLTLACPRHTLTTLRQGSLETTRDSNFRS